MQRCFVTSLIGAALVFTGAVFAQAPAPAPVPEAMPFDIPYGTPITLDQAKKVADAAMAEAKKRNWKMGVAIVGPAGDLVYYAKMDGTQNSSPSVSEGKARTAAIFRRSTKVFMDALESGHPYVMTLPGVVGADGGEPIVEGGKIIGAIGVGGGGAPQDGVVARAGAAAIK